MKTVSFLKFQIMLTAWCSTFQTLRNYYAMLQSCTSHNLCEMSKLGFTATRKVHQFILVNSVTNRQNGMAQELYATAAAGMQLQQRPAAGIELRLQQRSAGVIELV
jgi:hypothetical protein